MKGGYGYLHRQYCDKCNRAFVASRFKAVSNWKRAFAKVKAIVKFRKGVPAQARTRRRAQRRLINRGNGPYGPRPPRR